MLKIILLFFLYFYGIFIDFVFLLVFFICSHFSSVFLCFVNYPCIVFYCDLFIY